MEGRIARVKREVVEPLVERKGDRVMEGKREGERGAWRQAVERKGGGGGMVDRGSVLLADVSAAELRRRHQRRLHAAPWAGPRRPRRSWPEIPEVKQHAASTLVTFDIEVLCCGGKSAPPLKITLVADSKLCRYAGIIENGILTKLVSQLNERLVVFKSIYRQSCLVYDGAGDDVIRDVILNDGD